MQMNMAILIVANHPTKSNAEKYWMLGHLNALEQYAISQDGKRFVGLFPAQELETVIESKLKAHKFIVL